MKINDNGYHGSNIHLNDTTDNNDDNKSNMENNSAS